MIYLTISLDMMHRRQIYMTIYVKSSVFDNNWIMFHSQPKLDKNIS